MEAVVSRQLDSCNFTHKYTCLKTQSGNNRTGMEILPLNLKKNVLKIETRRYR